MTLIGQVIAMAVFVWFCMKYIWPVINGAIEARQTEIASGLAAAEHGQSSLERAKAEAGTIRKLYGANLGENAVHGSDSVENGRIECAYYFRGSELG